MTLPFIRPAFRSTRRQWLQESTFPLSNFGGGMNNVESDNMIADNECCDTKNMMFVSPTQMQKRYGFGDVFDGDTMLSILPEYDNPIVFIDTYKPNKPGMSPQDVRATKTTMYIGGDECRIALQGNNNYVRGVNYVGKYYFVDGECLRVYDGEEFYKIVSEPVGYLSSDVATNFTTFTLDSIPVQLKVGDPVFFLSSVISHTADVQDKVTAINKTTKTVTISKSLPYSMKKGSPIFFYIPLPNKYNEGEQVFDKANHLAYYKPCLNQLADSYTGAGYIPDKPNVITVHKDRLFIAGDSKQPYSVYMSWVTQPLWFPSGCHVSAKPDGEPIVDLVVFDDALIIGRHSDLYVLYGNSVYPDSSEPFNIKQMDVATGFITANCGSLINNFYIFLGNDGYFYKLNTPTTFVEYLMARPLPRKIDLSKPPFNMYIVDINFMSSITYLNEVWFNIGEYILVYSYDNMAWTYYTGFHPVCIYNEGRYVCCSQNADVIRVVYYQTFKEDNKYKDVIGLIDTPIEANITTKRYDLGDSIGFKYFRMFMFTTEAYDDFESEINVGYEIDYLDNDLPIIIRSNIAKFGKAIWGVDKFNNRKLHKTGWINIDARGRTIKFIISNNKQEEPMRIYDLNVLFSRRDVR